jgi:hypothetical protein
VPVDLRVSSPVVRSDANPLDLLGRFRAPMASNASGSVDIEGRALVARDRIATCIARLALAVAPVEVRFPARQASRAKVGVRPADDKRAGLRVL